MGRGFASNALELDCAGLVRSCFCLPDEVVISEESLLASTPQVSGSRRLVGASGVILEYIRPPATVEQVWSIIFPTSLKRERFFVWGFVVEGTTCGVQSSGDSRRLAADQAEHV